MIAVPKRGRQWNTRTQKGRMREDEEFVDLDRTFFELSDYASSSDDVDLTSAFGLSRMAWGGILEEYRVVILSEAGSGKTEEIRHATHLKRAEGKPAFFLRIEYLKDGLEAFAFEEGNIDEFNEWLESADEGWLFLDSVDEAKLGHPKDFERAILHLSSILRHALQRSHIFITSRATAWRPYTDLKLCKEKLRYEPPKQKAESGNSTAIENDGSAASNERRQIKEDDTPKKSSNAPFKLLSLRELTPDQIGKFVEAKGVGNADAFMDAVERTNAWTFTTRPLDLVDVVDFWKVNQRLGTRRELMEHNVARKLEEPKQEFRDQNPLSQKMAREGACLLAAAALLTGQSTIRIPDGSANQIGIDAKAVLSDWDDNEIKTLLARPIFDEAIYGTVRFHHREVREFLAAEWLHSLLLSGGSRRSIESLIFKNQYGIDLITPKLRPVLPWLCLLDEKIFKRVRSIAPELLFEGGDPIEFQSEIRAEVLTSVCEEIHAGTSGRSMMDYSAVQRFSSPDIGPTIKKLLTVYRNNENIIWFLLRMVWHGRIELCLPEARKYALDPDIDRLSTQAAIKALAAVGSQEELLRSFKDYISSENTINREIVGSYLECINHDDGMADRVSKAIRATPPPERFHVDGLNNALQQIVTSTDLDRLLPLIESFSNLLSEPPFIERRHCDVSDKYQWLLKIALQAVERLLAAKHPSCFKPAALHILQVVPIAREFASDVDFNQAKSRIPSLVHDWAELKWALFWYDVGVTREQLLQRDGDPLDDYWRVGVFGAFWRFTPDDFDSAVAFITSKSEPDDQKVAISLAFQFYKELGRPRKLREQLKRLVSRDPELKAYLSARLNPPPMTAEMRKWKRSEAGYARRQKAREKRDKDYHRGWRKWLKDNLDLVRSGVPDGELGAIYQCHVYLYDQLDREDGGSRYSRGDWKSLIGEVGEDAAKAFRDWSLEHWRSYPLKVRSEGIDNPNSIPLALILGLVGLQIESEASSDWATKLTKEEVEKAAKFALWEINGFPSWLGTLYEMHPDVVLDRFVTEMEWELLQNPEKEERLYVMHDLNYHEQEIAHSLSPKLAVLLEEVEPHHRDTLRYVLNILHSGEMSEVTLSTLAQLRINGLILTNNLAPWFAVWVGADPVRAIPRLEEHLTGIKNAKEATEFAVEFLAYLLGSRHESGIVGDAFKSPAHLTELYLLMLKHVREEDDIDRSGGGVYSPGPRDAAQEARGQLFSLLRDIQGKETFLALRKISQFHPGERSRAWMQHHMKTHAAKEADEGAWSIQQFSEFALAQERTPSTHTELFELAVSRFLDLKAELEEGDGSIAELVRKGADNEPEIRSFIGSWCRDKSAGRYVVPQEEELADATKPDLRFHGNGFDGPIPVELKLAENWSGAQLSGQIQNQLCGQYLRDERSSRGIFLLVKQDEKGSWRVPDSNGVLVEFDALPEALRDFWASISDQYPDVDRIEVIGIDLTKRLAAQNAKRRQRAAKKSKKSEE